MDRGINLPNVIDNTEIERFLLSKIQPRLARDVHDHVLASLTNVVPFGTSAAVASRRCLAGVRNADALCFGALIALQIGHGC